MSNTLSYEGFRNVTVSYTHLDVYKRQGKPAQPRNGHLQSVVSGDRSQTRRAAVHFILLPYADVFHDFRYLPQMK